MPYQTNDELGILAYQLDPRSRGRVRLTSRDPAAPPAIDLALLRQEHDVDALGQGRRGRPGPDETRAARGEDRAPSAAVRLARAAFVADVSVIPQIPRANVNLTCYVIGARVADLLA